MCYLGFDAIGPCFLKASKKYFENPKKLYCNSGI